MLYAIADKSGNTKLIVQDATNRTMLEAQYCIKMAVCHELRENGGVDFSNLADALHRNGFTIYGFRTVQIGERPTVGPSNMELAS